MRRRTFVAVSVTLLFVASCTAASELAIDETWAQEAEEVVALPGDA